MSNFRIVQTPEGPFRRISPLQHPDAFVVAWRLYFPKRWFAPKVHNADSLEAFDSLDRPKLTGDDEVGDFAPEGRARLVGVTEVEPRRHTGLVHVLRTP
jgi:hypothetical protein